VKHAGPLATIVAVFLLGACWVHPLRDVPVVDDWTYAWSVEQLLGTGHLRIAEISGIYPVAHILWGALFARLFGFSFGVLRLSTAVVAVAGCVALYFLLYELGCSRRWSTLGALTLAVYPVYFSLSFSFMTDVPAAALSLLALLFTVQAVRRDAPSRLWVAALFSVLAVFVRATAIAAPLAAAFAIPWRRDAWRWAAPVTAALAAFAIGTVVAPRAFGSLEWESSRFQQLQWLTTMSPREYLNVNLATLSHEGLAFAPLLLAAVVSRRAWWRIALTALALAAISWSLWHVLPTPLLDWSTWSLQDVGGSRVLIGGFAPVSAWSIRAHPFVAVVAIVAAASLLVAIGGAMQLIIAGFRSRGADLHDRRALIVIGGYLLLALGVVNVLWLYNDRYYLILVPAVASIGAWWPARLRAPLWTAALLLLPMGYVSLTGTRDMLDVNEVAAAAVRDLEATGVPPYEIDAGWALNGWRLWAHPGRLRPGTDRRYGVPFVTSKEETPYLIASAAHPGYEVVRSLPLPHASWQATDRVYVLKRLTK
jgi:hypothetical protein